MPLKSKSTTVIIAIAIPVCIIVIASSLVISKYYHKFKKAKDTVVAKTLAANTPQSKAYEAMMIDFSSMSNMAQGIFPLDTTEAGKQKSLSDLKDIGIYYWNRSWEVLEESKKNMELTIEMKTTINLCQEYCVLNKKYYELIYKALDEKTEKYYAKMELYVDSVDTKLKEIRAREY
ncbi:hypothetical protein [Pedobacter xixiisoli]|uniref:Uncharacterized protein n=1 Tax=Pedobacter xixiisoli TaxID=1476464 RepID=A0A285ZPS6_9SPHI|nr:hypothetical protein [Pedobacter xixiisoli]SOD11628.1 hypothetical protein SAMN06297358_0250 [Pedobacter xixiisoli]